MNSKHYNIRITGKVQGVFFRASTKAVADQLGIKGFVLNRDDGSVYTEAEGDDLSIELFLDFCRKGPEHAIVENVEVSQGDIKNFRNFEVVKR